LRTFPFDLCPQVAQDSHDNLLLHLQQKVVIVRGLLKARNHPPQSATLLISRSRSAGSPVSRDAIKSTWNSACQSLCSSGSTSTCCTVQLRLSSAAMTYVWRTLR